jgi:hypothetical protein
MNVPRWLERRSTRTLAAGAAISLAVVGLFTLTTVALVAAGEETADDWQVVSAVAAVASTFASIATLAALAIAVGELDSASQDVRVSRKPYIRADIAFREDVAREDNLEFPEGIRLLSLRELGQEPIRFPPDSEPVPLPGEPALTLVVWATNLQSAPLGFADHVRLNVRIDWKGPDEASYRDTVVELAYLAPGQTTAIEVARVRWDVPYFFAQIASVEYEDIFQSAGGDTHGALRMRYSDGRVLNQREVIRYESSRSPANVWR